MKNRPVRLRIMALVVALCGMVATVAVAGTVSASTTAPGHLSRPAVTAAAASKVPVVIACFRHGQVRPRRYVLACGDGNEYLAGLRWSSWTSHAFGSGTHAFNDCVPFCARGHFHSFRVLVVLWRAEPRPGHAGERYFTRFTLIYTGKRSYRAGGRVHHLPVTSTRSLSAAGG